MAEMLSVAWRLESATRMMNGYFSGYSNAAHKGRASAECGFAGAAKAKDEEALFRVGFEGVDQFRVEGGRRVGEVAGEVDQRKALAAILHNALIVFNCSTCSP